jgi:hypothetical protein
VGWVWVWGGGMAIGRVLAGWCERHLVHQASRWVAASLRCPRFWLTLRSGRLSGLAILALAFSAAGGALLGPAETVLGAPPRTGLGPEPLRATMGRPNERGRRGGRTAPAGPVWRRRYHDALAVGAG